jgi:hypothetical protein
MDNRKKLENNTLMEDKQGKRSWTEYVSGKAKWVCAHKPNQYGDYKMDLYPDEQSLSKIMKWKEEGLKNVIRKDDDGAVIAFKRASSKLIRGKVVGFGPPEIIDAEGKPTPHVQVGNGSDVTVRINIYRFNGPTGSKPGIATRWDALRIDNLVPYNASKDMNPTQANQVGKLAEQPVPSYNF